MNLYNGILLLFYFICVGNCYILPNIPKLNKNKIYQTHIKEIDKQIIDLSKTTTINYIMIPIVSMIDTLSISYLGNQNDIIGSNSAEQIFILCYYISSFLPPILTPKISNLKEKLKRCNNQTEKENIKHQMNNIISISLLIGLIVGIISNFILFQNHLYFLKLSMNHIESLNTAVSYLKYRSFGIIPTLLNTIIFSILRGCKQLDKAIYINISSQLINIILNPIMMKMMGVKGIALSSVISDIYLSILFIFLLIKNKYITTNLKNIIGNSISLLKEGILIQFKNILSNVLTIYQSKKISSYDIKGNYLTSYILINKYTSLFQILYLSLSSVTTIMISSEKENKRDEIVKSRIFRFNYLLGFIQSIIIIICIPFFNLITDNKSVQNIISSHIYYVIPYLFINGLSYIYDGIYIGYQKFKRLSFINLMILSIMLMSVNYLPNLSSIWLLNMFVNIIKIYSCHFYL